MNLFINLISISQNFNYIYGVYLDCERLFSRRDFNAMYRNKSESIQQLLMSRFNMIALCMKHDAKDLAEKIIHLTQQLKAAVCSNTSLYTGLYYKNTTGPNFSYIGNVRAWIAQYPFTPSSNSLWNTTYGMWQWNSNTSFPDVSGTFDVSIDYTNLIKQAAKYKVGNVIRIASNDWSETNGYTLVNRQNWIVTVVSANQIYIVIQHRSMIFSIQTGYTVYTSLNKI